MTLYIDVIFLENIVMNSIILFATAVILKTQIKIWRILISSIIGSVYAIVIYVSKIELYSNVFLKLLLSVVIVYIAFRPPSIKSLFKHIVIFYLTSFTFGGVAFALLYFVSPQDILYQDGVFIGTYPIKMILAGGIIGFIIITVAFKNIKVRLNHKDMYCNLKINFCGKETAVTAIVDTGNFLRDPISKLPVVVIESEKLDGVFPISILDSVNNIINGQEVELGDYSSKIRMIPFKSLGKENGLLLGIKVDEIEVEYQDIQYKHKDVIVGIYSGNLSRNGKYAGLVGVDVISE